MLPVAGGLFKDIEGIRPSGFAAVSLLSAKLVAGTVQWPAA